MIKASDLRLKSVRPSMNVMEKVELCIREAYEKGLSQTNVVIPDNCDLMGLKKTLKKNGFGAVTYKESGILATNLIVPARTFVKVFW
jgi:hypothetical protein